MPKIVDHSLYRKELLTCAFDLFAERGYGSVTMRELALHLGVSTGTLYHYFPSKEALFLQLVEELTRQDITAFTQEHQGSLTLAERIEVIFSYVSQRETYILNQSLISIEFLRQHGREEPHIHAVFNQSSQDLSRVLVEFLGIEDPVLVQLIYCLLTGILFNRFEGEQISFSDQARLLTKMLTAYLETQTQLLETRSNP